MPFSLYLRGDYRHAASWLPPLIHAATLIRQLRYADDY